MLLRWILLSCLLAGACTPVPTGVRRSLLAPTVTLPKRNGAPLPAHHVQLAAEVGGARLVAPDDRVQQWDRDEPAPSVWRGKLGDPGVLIPKLHVGGSAYVAPSSLVEVGVHGQYTEGDWSRANIRGVLRPPDNPAQWDLGTGIRLNARPAGPVVVSLFSEFDVTSIHETTFTCVECEEEELPEKVRYRVHHADRSMYLRPNFALLVGAQLDALYVGGIVGAQTSFRNIGFDRLDRADEDTVEAYWAGYAGAGIDYQAGAFALGLHTYLPFGGERKIRFGLRSQLYLAYRIGLTRHTRGR